MNCSICNEDDSDGRKFYNIADVCDNPLLSEVANRINRNGAQLICSHCIVNLLDNDPVLRQVYLDSHIKEEIDREKRQRTRRLFI